MKVVVRKARANELKVIQDMNYRLFLWDYDRDLALNVKWPYEETGEAYFRKKISGESGVCFVAELRGELVGYVAGRVDKNVDATDTLLRSELENIYIEESSRAKGIGKLLTNTFIEWCKDNGAQSIFVTAYYENQNAIKFYEACGFNAYALKLEKNLLSTPSSLRNDKL